MRPLIWYLATAMSLALPIATLGQPVTYDFTSDNGGWTPSGSGGSGAAAWQYGSPGNPGGSPDGWFTSGQANVGSYFLSSPVLTVLSNGAVTGAFSHRFNYESGFDGGQIQFSLNGGAFNTIPENLIAGVTYNSTISGNFSSPIGLERAFSGQSTGFSNPDFVFSTFIFGTGVFPFSTGAASNFVAGDQIVFRFLGAWDLSNVTASPNWHITAASFNNVAVSSVPEPTTVALGGLSLAGTVLGIRRIRAKRRSAMQLANAAVASECPTETGGRVVRWRVRVRQPK